MLVSLCIIWQIIIFTLLLLMTYLFFNSFEISSIFIFLYCLLALPKLGMPTRLIFILLL